MSGQEEKDDGNEEGMRKGMKEGKTSDEGGGFCLADFFFIEKKGNSKTWRLFFHQSANHVINHAIDW